jgi:glycosyltransferase involved in cell wall biosynthesis
MLHFRNNCFVLHCEHQSIFGGGIKKLPVTSKKNIIYLNGRFLSQSITGVQRYAIELILAIDKYLAADPAIRDRFEYTLLVPHTAKHLPVLKYITKKQVGRFSGHLWEQVELPFYTRHGLLVGFCNTGPLFRRNQVVTFCDASVYKVPMAYSLPFRLWYRMLFTTIGSRAKGLLTISYFSRDELVACCGIPIEKITVTFPGIDHQGWNDNREKQNSNCLHSTDRPFVLAVSSMSPHKNFGALVEAVTLLGETDFDVIIAGGTNPAIFKNADIPLPSTIKHVGYVSDETLKYLYSQAACFIYPSLYEGFGLPPLEAMSNECPVIVARAGSLPEVCGDAALYCDPNSPQDIADKISTMMSDVKLRDEFRTKGKARSNIYTWEKCARKTLSVIERALEQ